MLIIFALFAALYGVFSFDIYKACANPVLVYQSTIMFWLLAVVVAFSLTAVSLEIVKLLNLDIEFGGDIFVALGGLVAFGSYIFSIVIIAET